MRYIVSVSKVIAGGFRAWGREGGCLRNRGSVFGQLRQCLGSVSACDWKEEYSEVLKALCILVGKMSGIGTWQMIVMLERRKFI